MTQDEELIALAVQANLCDEYGTINWEYGYRSEIIAYGKLVAAKERERYMQLFLDPENQPTQFGTATQEYREQEIKAEREALEIELLKLKQGVAANSDYIQGRWDLIGEFQDIIKARGGAWTS